MADTIFELMKRASIFMIAAQMLIHFGPNESYEKYLKLLAGIMITAILIIPILQIFGKETGREFEREMKRYQQQLDHAIKGISPGAETGEDMYIPGIEKEIKSRLNNKNIEKVIVTEENKLVIVISETKSGNQTEEILKQCESVLGVPREAVEVVTDGSD